MPYFIHAFCLAYSMDGEGVPKNWQRLFDIKIRGKNVSVVKLRHAKVVDGIHVRNQRHAFVPVSHRRVVIFF